MRMYCITVDNNHYEKIQRLGYIPVGLGNKIFSKKFETDNRGDNISLKNPFYGEYSFHYWLWKNELQNFKDKEWVGFCQYRKFWSISANKENYKDIDQLNKYLIKQIPEVLNEYETILGNPLFINQLKPIKFFKKNFFKMLKNPNLLFDKKKRNIKFHFDLMHGEGNLEKAISLLDHEYKKDFEEYVNTEVSFNPHNMFICNSKKNLNDFYSVIFPWLERCENKFGFNLEGYGLRRIYGFLAERFMPFWFKKNTRCTTLPIIFKDISEID